MAAKDPATCDGALDPHEVLDFVLPFSLLLETDEAISDGDFTITLSAEAVAKGLTILDQAPYSAPELSEDDKSIVVWFTIDDAEQGNAAFEAPGTVLSFEALLETTSSPPRIRNRTFNLLVVQQ